MTIYILIPVFKRLEHTKKFVASCESHISKEKRYIIIDDSLDYEHAEFFGGQPKFVILKGNGNLWWGGSVNKGLIFLQTDNNTTPEDILIIANNDVIINDKTWDNIYRHLKTNTRAIYSPRVFNLQNQEIKSGATLKNWIPLRANYILQPSEALTQVDFITGRFLCSTWAVAKLVGGISENLPHYGGDWDYSLKAKKKAISTYMVKDSICHVDESTTGLRYEKGLTIRQFYNALFTDIKSPQNIFYKYKFYRNHNSLLKSIIGIIAQLMKTIVKFIINKF